MLEMVIDQRRRDLGGFEVGRVLPFAKRKMIGPFIFFDSLGPIDFAPSIPRSVDVRPHPHIGLSTVTYLFAGEIMHRDSLATEQAIVPGEVNWMTAGSGITHSERFEKARREGGALHGIQAWLALPREQEEVAPHFVHYGASQLPTQQAEGVLLRVIAGEAFGLRSQVKTFSPLYYVHAELEAGARCVIPRAAERAAYVVSGAVIADGRTFSEGQLLVFSTDADAFLAAATNSVLMLIGGEPLGERFIDWNFVSSSKDRIEQAKSDWRTGRMKLPDFDHDEFIPLPDDSFAK